MQSWTHSKGCGACSISGGKGHFSKCMGPVPTQYHANLDSYWLVAVIPILEANYGWGIRRADKTPPLNWLDDRSHLSADRWSEASNRLTGPGPEWAIALGKKLHSPRKNKYLSCGTKYLQQCSEWAVLAAVN